MSCFVILLPNFQRLMSINNLCAQISADENTNCRQDRILAPDVIWFLFVVRVALTIIRFGQHQNPETLESPHPHRSLIGQMQR